MAAPRDPTVAVRTLPHLLELLCANERKGAAGRACVTVIDVYCHTWGPCNAVRGLYKEMLLQHVDESRTRLTFAQVDALAVLGELRALGGDAPPFPASARSLPAEDVVDVHPDSWRARFEQQVGQARPLFMFWKDRRLVSEVAQVDTPLIRRTILDLIKDDTRPSQFITNAGMLEQWEADIGDSVAAAAWAPFLAAVMVWCTLHHEAPLSAEEQGALRDALGVSAAEPVTARQVQAFVGDGSFVKRFREVCPGYEERVAAERAASRTQPSPKRKAAQP